MADRIGCVGALPHKNDHSQGLYQRNRVHFGLCAPPSCLQKIILEITHGVDGITNLQYDILVVGYGDADHATMLDALIDTISKRNATLSYERSEIGVADLHIAGLTIDQRCVRPIQSILDALIEFPEARTVKELDCFLCILSTCFLSGQNFAQYRTSVSTLSMSFCRMCSQDRDFPTS